MTRPVRPYTSGMLFVPELLVREIVLEGLFELAGDKFRLDEMFGRHDESLHTGTSTEWLLEMKQTFRKMLDETSHGITVGVGYPHAEAHLPFVSIVTEGGSEDDASAAMGDMHGRGAETIGTAGEDDYRVVDHRHIGIDWNTTVQIGAWCTAPEQSAVLHSVLLNLMFRHKGRMVEGGPRDVRLSQGAFEPNQTLHPRTSYVPVVSARLSSTMIQTRRTDNAPHVVSVLPGTHGN